MHCAVVCPQSTPLAAALYGSFRVVSGCVKVCVNSGNGKDEGTRLLTMNTVLLIILFHSHMGVVNDD